MLAYLRECPFEVRDDGPLVFRPDGRGFAEADVTAFNFRLRKVSGGVVPTLADLTRISQTRIGSVGASETIDGL